MGSPTLSRPIYRFGLFEAHPASGLLLRQGVRVKLQDQPFRVLCLLLDRPGEIVTREELRRTLWPADTYVEFDGSLNAALKRLRSALGDSSDNPIFIETVPKRGYRFIAPVSREEGEDVVSDTSAAPASEQDATHGSVSPPNQARWSPVTGRNLVLVITVLVVAMIGSLPIFRSRLRHRAEVSSREVTLTPVPHRQSIAVLGFRNVSGRSDDAWLATALPEMLSTELAAGEKLRLIASEEVANLRVSSPWSQTDTLGQETTVRIGTALNSDLLVMGSFASIGKAGTRQLRLDASLQNAKTGVILAEVAEVGGAEDPFQLISRIGARLRDRLGVPAATGEEKAAAIAALPSSLEAARFYALGLEKLRSFDMLTACDLLQQVTTIDPKFALGHARLAESWKDLGYSHKAEAEAKLALDLSTKLPRTEKLLIEALYYEAQGRQDKAASAYRVLFSAFPDSVEYGIKLARALGRSGQAQEGLATVSALRQLPPPASEDAGIDLIEAQLLFHQDYKKEVQLLRDASRETAARGQKLLYARVKSSECLILPGGSEAQSALASCEEARDLFLAAGNRDAAGYVLERMAGHYTFAGQMEEAFRYYDQALRIAQETGDRVLAGVVLTNMGMHVQDQGELERAEKMFRQARRSFADTGDRTNEAVAVGKIGDILLARGRLNDAAKIYEEARQVGQSIDSRAGASYVMQIAVVRKIQGRMREARQLIEQSVALYREMDDPGALAQAINTAGHVMLAEGDFQGARKRYEEARDLRQKIAVLPDLADSKVSFALLALAEGRPAEAEPPLKDAIVEFEKDRSVGSQVMGNVTLSRALQEQGKLDDAQKAVAIALDLTSKSSDPGLKLLVAIQRARVESASAAPDAAGKKQISRGEAQLRSAIVTAKELGYYESECEARLALGELELKTNPRLGRLQLSALAKEAYEQGLELMARKATQLSSYSSIPVSNAK